MVKLQKGSKKLLNAWAFYDWANSVYSLVISSTIFPIFYGALTITRSVDGGISNDRVELFGWSFNNDSLISYATALAFLLVAVSSPLLSGIADVAGNKKTFLKFFCYLGALSCIGLFWFELDTLWFGLLCYMLALIGYWSSLVFYNSYLPDIAYPEQQDRLSAKGFSLGYLGSVILLILCLLLIMKYEWFGFQDESFPTRLSFVLTGLWWISFSQITYHYLPRGEKRKQIDKDVLLSGYKELKKIWRAAGENRKLKNYLQAFFVYSMGVQTVMLIATYFGIEEVDWGAQNATTGLIISILLIQLIAILGAQVTSRLAVRHGNIKTLIGINVIWIGICVYAFFVKTPVAFYIAAALVGFVMGGIQSLSRSTYSKLLPPKTKDSTSFFSFYDVSEKVGIVLGMLLYGMVNEIFGSARIAVIFIGVFFLVGVLLLLRVPQKE